jgi:hypothetical protein
MNDGMKKKIDPNDNKSTQIKMNGIGRYVGIINFMKGSKN